MLKKHFQKVLEAHQKVKSCEIDLFADFKAWPDKLLA